MTNYITNVIASIVISISTNVTSGDNGVDGYNPFYVTTDIHIVVQQPWQGRQATEKWEKTEVVKTTTITFKALGTEWSCENIEILSTTNRYWKIKREWEEADAPESQIIMGEDSLHFNANGLLLFTNTTTTLEYGE